MTARGARSIKSAAVLFAALLCLAGARNAQAQTPGCMVDTDCPNSACGGDVCTHTTSGGFACNLANTQAGKGFDGWCADADGVAHDDICKCKGLGATCAGFFCTFTVPVDAPMTGTGGASAGGAGGAGGGAAGSSAGGRGGTTGSAGGAAGTTAGSGGGGGGDGGGCNVSGAASATGGVVGLLLLVAASVRRRRSGAVG